MSANSETETIELTRAMTLILLVLMRGERHGYAVMSEIESLTDDEYRVSAGTLYRSIGQMLLHKLVEEAPELFDQEHDDSRRKYYRITTSGREAIALELWRLEKLIQKAKS